MESLVTPPGPTSPKTNGTDAFVVDPNLIVEYLASVLEITLGATRQDLERNGSLLSSESRPHTIQRCTRFSSENQAALYVTKDITSSGGIDGVLDGPSNCGLRRV
jgi:dynein heavy chain 1